MVTDDSSFTLIAEFPEEWGDLAKLYIDGEEIAEPNVYVFSSDAENVLIEIRIGEQVVYSTVVGIDVDETPYVPPVSVDPGGSGSQQSPAPGGDISVSVSEKTKKALIIAGSVAGGVIFVAGIAILVVVIIKKNKGKGK